MFQPKEVTPDVAAFLADYVEFVRVQKGKGGRPSISISSLEKHTRRAREIVETLGFEFSAERLKAFMVRKTVKKSTGTWNQWVDAVKMLDRYVRCREKTAQPCAINGGFFDADLIGQLAVPKRSRKVHDPISREELDSVIEAATKQGDEESAFWLRIDWNLLGRAEETNQIKRGDFAFATQQAREYDADAGCTSARTSRMQRRPAPVSSGSYGGRATRRYSGTGLSARPSSPPTTSSGAARPPRRGIHPAKNPAAR